MMARTSKAVRQVIADLKKKCMSIAFCNKCPYWDDDLECRIGYPVANWYIDDWEEYKNEQSRYSQENLR